MLHREIPFLRICIPLCAGIVSGLYFKPALLTLLISAGFIAILFVLSFSFNKYRENFFFGAPVTLALFVLGNALYNNEKNSLTAFGSEPYEFSCTLSGYPEEKSATTMLTVKLNHLIRKTGAEPVCGSMLLYHKKDPGTKNFLPGDRLLIRCTPLEIETRGNPYEFNYKFYMENQGIKYYAFTGRKDILNHETPAKRKLVHKALITRQKIIEMYRKRGISEERLPLVAALTLGEKSMLDRDQKENFIRAGVMHIMAVSGLHAVILSLFVLNMLFFLKRRFNILRVGFAVLFLWAFAFVTGLTPSVLRATLMFTFIQAGNLIHRKVNGINSVLASAFVLILDRPSVIFDTGFLLSYSAVIFIIAFYSDLYLKLRPGHRVTDWIWQSVAVTIVAQLGTLPLTIMLFNRFPAYFLLTNTVIVPLSSLAIILGCIVPVLYPLKLISGLLGTALDRLTGLTEFLTEKAADFPGSSIGNIGMTVPECLLMITVITAATAFTLKKRSLSLSLLLILIIVYMAAGTFREFAVRTTGELIVYNSVRPVIGIRTGKVLNVYSDTIVPGPEVTKHAATLGLRTRMNLLDVHPVYLNINGRNVLICNDPGTAGCISEPDIIVATGKFNSTAVTGRFRGYVIAMTASRDQGGTQGGNIHYIRKSGAYRTRL